VDVRTEVEGEITSIKIEGEQATVTVEGGAEKVSYKLPANAVQRDEGDYMYPGDTIGIYKRWYLGLFFDGMWLTLYLSVVSIFFGILLGLIAGLVPLERQPGP
jgi:polar amino acid transport system permease protein